MHSVLLGVYSLFAAAPQPVRLDVDKSDRKLFVIRDKDTLMQLPIGLGRDAEPGGKEIMGDRKTPEGRYVIRQRNPNSKFYKSFTLDYPSVQDASKAKSDGRIGARDYRRIVQAHNEGKLPPQGTALGGDICIHGGSPLFDWTAGCIAVGDPAMDSLWNMVSVGTVVTISE